MRYSAAGSATWVGATALLALLVLTAPVQAIPTSCDIVTGASCVINEGCDCDHDGFVRDTGKSWKYCKFQKCPIDADDSDPKVLGKVSQFNADGDGWTAQFDCNDNDKNIFPGSAIACCNCEIIKDPDKYKAFGCSKGCPLSLPPVDAGPPDAGPTDTGPEDTGPEDTGPEDTGPGDTGPADTGAQTSDTSGGDSGGAGDAAINPADLDKDKDGVPAKDDCDDDDPNIKPKAAVACCSCEVLTDPKKKELFGCLGGCPLSGSADAGTTSVDSSSSADSGAGSIDGGSAALDVGGGEADTGGGSGSSGAGTPDVVQDVGSGPAIGGWDAGSVEDGAVSGGGSFVRPEPPAPGCSSGPADRSGGWAALILGALCLFLLRRKKTFAALLVLVALLGSGCVRVQPWQRATLAKRCMTIGSNAGELQLEQHTFQYREGAAGGFGGGGGGCGCN